MIGIISTKSIIVALILPLVIVLSSDHIQYPKRYISSFSLLQHGHGVAWNPSFCCSVL